MISQNPEKPVLLVTGGAGFVGSHLLPKLRRRYPDHHHVLFVRPGQPPAEVPGWDSVALELTDEPDVEQQVARLKPALLVHLAAQSSVGQASSAAELTWRVNFNATFALARAVGRHCPDSVFFFTSSGEVYGSSFLSGPASEKTPAAPANSYAISKLAAERMLQDVLPQSTRLVIVRPFNHSGRGQDERFVLPSMAGQIARAEAGLTEPRIHVGNLSAARDFLHVDDVVDAYMRLLAMGDRLPARTLVNIASGQPVPISELVDQLCALSMIPVEITLDPQRMRPSEIPIAAGNADQIAAMTGWVKKRPLSVLLADLMDDARGRVRAGKA